MNTTEGCRKVHSFLFSVISLYIYLSRTLCWVFCGNLSFTCLMQLVFTSFSADDEDYRGYEYSLFGQLSEVRIIYLNRFIQEVKQYRITHRSGYHVFIRIRLLICT